MVDDDAPEIDHGEALWNCATELRRRVDEFFDDTRLCKRQQLPMPRLTEDLVQIVDTLRALRNVIREIARRIALKIMLKTKAVPTVPNENIENNENTSEEKTSGPMKVKVGKESSARAWATMVEDIDICLHDFRYRNHDSIPKLRLRKDGNDEVCREITESDKPKFDIHRTELERVFTFMTKKSPYLMEDSTIATVEQIHPAERLVIQFLHKEVTATVHTVAPVMKAALLSFEDYTSFFDEYIPYENLRLPVAGESSVEVDPEHVVPGKTLIERKEGEEYRGVVQSTHSEPFLHVEMDIGKDLSLKRWLPFSAVRGYSTDNV